MPRNRNIAGDATRMARQAASNLANLQRAMHAAQDTATGLQRVISAPNTTPRRHTIRKSTTSAPLLFTLLGFGLTNLFGGDLGSSDGDGDNASSGFSASNAQVSSAIVRSMNNGQRIL